MSENRGIKSSALYQCFARMWSTHEGTARRYSLYDRYLAVRDCVHAIGHLAERDDLPFDVRANAQSILRDGIYNAIDHRATGREWRNIRHTYNNERDGPHPPTEAEKDRRCERCGAIQPKPFTHCEAKDHTLAATPPTSTSDNARRAAEVAQSVVMAGRVVNINAHGEPTRVRLQEIQTSVSNGYEREYRKSGWSKALQFAIRDLHFLLTFFRDDVTAAAPADNE